MNDLVKPVLNINGTPGSDLIEHRMNARVLLESLIFELQRIAPNGRDYPGVDHFEHDRAVHFRRLGALRTLHDDLTKEALALHRQMQGE